uniref:VWFA domain-containing protein n=1 Tax=Plectus sambesii TaxID=2011161 RepID=A0A914WIX0_9BILA
MNSVYSDDGTSFIIYVACYPYERREHEIMKFYVAIAALVLIPLISGSNPTNQTCTSIPCIPGTTFADIVVVLDVSTAMVAANLAAVRDFLHMWANMYSIGPNAGQVQFVFVTYEEIPDSLGTFSSASPNAHILSENIDKATRPQIEDNDVRDIFGALEMVHNTLLPSDQNSGYRNTSEHILIVISAGTFTGTSTQWMPVADSLRSAFHQFVAIGLGQGVIPTNYAQLVQLTNNADNVFFAPSSNDLKYVVGWLLEITCRNHNGGSLKSS